ncbi:MAG TPA: signal peptidase I, partial [Actinomycetales bacterium]
GSRRGVFGAIASSVLVLGLWLSFAPAQLGGATTYVSTRGISMEPGFSTGDLAILQSSTDYAVGDVVAYRSEKLRTVVMHRIVAVEDGRFTLQGDNNDFLDPDHPTSDDILGELQWQVPGGGKVLKLFSQPPVIAFFVFVLLASGSAVAGTRRRRRRTMSRHAAPAAPRTWSIGTLPPLLTTTASALAVAGLVGLLLGALAWTRPATVAEKGIRSVAQTMDFSYVATVPRSAAYDSTTVTSPAPVYRKLTQTVDVRYAYTGLPGTITVNGVLKAAGWTSTIILVPTESFSDRKHKGSVRLDLRALEARARAAAVAAGIAVEGLTVSVTPTVKVASGATFAPAYTLSVSSLQVSAGESPTKATASVSMPVVKTVVQKLGPSSRQIPVDTARTLSLALVAIAGAGLTLLVLIAGLGSPASEGAGIRRRYKPILIQVQPMPMPAGRPVIDVNDFATLSKLAQRYGLLVLHWSRSGVETFIVQDDSTTFRYRAGIGTVDIEAETIASSSAQNREAQEPAPQETRASRRASRV